MARKNYPTWVRVGVAAIGAVAVFAVVIGAIALFVKFLDAVGARVN